MYCKKCGTEQKEGQKFCPKCGEPYLVAKDTPIQNGDEDGGKKAKDSLAVKAEELSQKGKAFIEEKVQPQIKEKVEEFKKIDWEEKKNESVKNAQIFFSDKNKMRKATIWISIISVLWFFIFRRGFSASWYWWLFAILFISAALYKVETKDDDDALKKTRWSLLLSIFIGIVFVFYSPRNSSSLGNTNDSEIDVKAKNPQEEETVMRMANIYGEIKSLLPKVEALYNAHRQHLANGAPHYTSPAWGKWQDCRNKINSLWDEYIRLAKSLDDNEEIIEEAEKKRRVMNKSMDEMFVPRM